MVDILMRSGWLEVLTIHNKSMANSVKLIHEVLIKRKEAADQFFAGLETLGVLSLVRSNPQLMRSYFVDNEDIVQTSNCILAHLTGIHQQFDCEQKERARLFFIEAGKSAIVC